MRQISKKTLMGATLLILVVATLNFSGTSICEEASTGGDGLVTVQFSPKGTYLHAETAVASPGIVDLQNNGITEGDTVIISFEGSINKYGDPEVYGYDPITFLIGVFSSTSELLSINDPARVPGAIETGVDHVTPKTHFQQETTDIPQDFKISPYTGFEITVPFNARFLFVCFSDSYYADNVSPEPIKVSVEKDTDGDGLPDSWEINGVDVDKDGEIDLHLQALGADWQHKDVFVEIDYMEFSGDHTHRPNQDAINEVIQAFDNALVDNPDGSTGINLHVYVDDAVPHAETITWQGFDQIKSNYFGTASERTNPKNVEAKKQAFHYCIFAHSQEGTTSSGSGEVPGNDFMVTLGNWTNSVGSDDEQAGTFMHELGHNLGLKHGGNDEINYKPNYVSVMNYLFQNDGYNIGRALDFSYGNCFDLNEASLNESEGIGDFYDTVWVSSNGTLCRSGGYWEIDWNYDGNVTDSVQVNVNNHVSLGYNSTADENLTDYDDWANLAYRFRGTLGFADGQHPELPDEELTAEIAEAMSEQANTIAEPLIIPEFSPLIMFFTLIVSTIAVSVVYRRRKSN